MKRKAFMTLIGKVYKKTADDLAENDLKLSDENSADDAELDDNEVAKVLTSLDGEKVTSLTKTNFDKGFSKGKLQTATQFEKSLRDAFDVDDATLAGDALIEHIKDIAPEAGIPADISKLTAEDVVKLPAVKTIIQQHKKALNDLSKKHTEEIEAERGKQSEAQQLSEVAKLAEGRLNRDGLKVNLPEDAAKREARIDKLLRSELKGVKWKKEGNSYVPVGEDGVQLEDANGNPLDFNSYVDGIIDTNFDFVKADSLPPVPGNKNHQQRQRENKSYTGRKPTNQDDYLDLLTGEELDTDQKEALRETFSGQNW